MPQQIDYTEAVIAVISFYRFHHTEFPQEMVQQAIRLLMYRDEYYGEGIVRDRLQILIKASGDMGLHSVDDDDLEICHLARIIEIVNEMPAEYREALAEARLVGGVPELEDFFPKIHRFESVEEGMEAFAKYAEEVGIEQEARRQYIQEMADVGLDQFGRAL